MRVSGRWVAALLLSASGWLTACGSATRPIVEPSTQALTENKRSVAVVKFSMPDAPCRMHFLWIGARDADGHRLVRGLFAAGEPPPTTANAAEIELEPGEYHVLGGACQRARTTIGYGSRGGPHTLSLASFRIGPER